jgi:hypothetical protein
MHASIGGPLSPLKTRLAASRLRTHPLNARDSSEPPIRDDLGMPPSVARSQLPNRDAHATKEQLGSAPAPRFSDWCCTNNTGWTPFDSVKPLLLLHFATVSKSRSVLRPAFTATRAAPFRRLRARSNPGRSAKMGESPPLARSGVAGAPRSRVTRRQCHRFNCRAPTPGQTPSPRDRAWFRERS